MTAQKEIRDGIGEGLLQAGIDNVDVVALAADLTKSVGFNLFKDKFPERFFQTGVAEQNMTGIAAGLALSGKIPFTGSFAVFSPGRNWDQLRVSICLSEANVKIIGSHAGFSNAPDGASHQALEDIALTRVLPNLTVIVPADAKQATEIVIEAAKHRGPVYIRSFKGKAPALIPDTSVFEIGKAQVLTEGHDLTLITNGPILNEVLIAAKNLKENYHIHTEVINCHTVKPLDMKTILASALKTRKVLTVEEHQVAGGLGSAIAEQLCEHPVLMKIMGVDDLFGESGTRAQLLEKHGLSSIHIELEAKNLYHK